MKKKKIPHAEERDDCGKGTAQTHLVKARMSE